MNQAFIGGTSVDKSDGLRGTQLPCQGELPRAAAPIFPRAKEGGWPRHHASRGHSPNVRGGARQRAANFFNEVTE
jgi:hypothetical protein